MCYAKKCLLDGNQEKLHTFSSFLPIQPYPTSSSFKLVHQSRHVRIKKVNTFGRTDKVDMLLFVVQHWALDLIFHGRLVSLCHVSHRFCFVQAKATVKRKTKEKEIQSGDGWPGARSKSFGYVAPQPENKRKISNKSKLLTFNVLKFEPKFLIYFFFWVWIWIMHVIYSNNNNNNNNNRVRFNF